MKYISRQSGFTLIELLLYISIVGGLLLSIVLFSAVTTDSRSKNQAVAEVDQQGAYILNTIAQSIRNATAINSPAIGATGSTLSITTVTPANNPTVFDTSSGVMRITEGTGSSIPLSSNLVTISVLTFKNVSRATTPGAVRISFTITRGNVSNQNSYFYEKSFATTVALR